MEEMDKFLEKYKLWIPTQEEMKNLNRPTINEEIELVNKKTSSLVKYTKNLK